MKRFALLTAACAVLIAQSTSVELDPAKSEVEYRVATTLHTVHGTFQLKRGSMQFDEATGKASGELVVDAASGSSGGGARDKRMNKEILETDHYPEIVFRPDRMNGKLAAEGASQVQLHGIFSIHGKDHEMTVPVDVQAAAGLYNATAHFTVPYIEWGMKNPSNFLLKVSDKVDITVRTTVRIPRMTAD